MSGLLPFLVQVAVQRNARAEGKAAEAFLEVVCNDLLLQAAMMCDASSETLQLIRALDTEDIPVADLCANLQAFLTRLSWLFNDRGRLQVEGHTRHIMQWLATPHFVSADGRGKFLGGGANGANIATSMGRMRAWVKLVHSIVEAEFPAFGVISAFSLASTPTDVGPGTRTKLERLANAFGKADLVRQFTDHLAWVARAFQEGCHGGSHWNAWATAIRVTRGLPPGNHPSDILLCCGAARHVLRPDDLAHRAVLLRCCGEARDQALGRAADPIVKGDWVVAPQVVRSRRTQSGVQSSRQLDALLRRQSHPDLLGRARGQRRQAAVFWAARAVPAWHKADGNAILAELPCFARDSCCRGFQLLPAHAWRRRVGTLSLQG